MQVAEFYKIVLPYLFFAVFLLFSYHAAEGFLLYRKHKETSSKNHIFMCIFSSVYGFLFFLVYSGYFQAYNHKLYYTCWLFGFASYLRYVGLIKWYLKIDVWFFNLCQKSLILVTFLYLSESISVWGFDTSFFMATYQDPSHTPYFFKVVGIHSKPTVPGLIVGFFGAISVMGTALFVLKELIQKHPGETLLKAGVILSMCVGVNDIVLGLELIPWSFAMVYFGNAFEAFRFTNYYQELSYKKIYKLQNELSKVAKLAHVGFVASSINHDIMNPLTLVQGARLAMKMRLEKQSLSQENAKKYLHNIESGCQRIKDIIASYTALIRHEPLGKLPLISVDEIFKDSVELSKSRIHTSGVNVDIDLNENWYIEANLSDISLVLTNLINNSCDELAKKEGSWIRLGAEKIGDFLYLSVTDSGHGIPLEIQDKIFDLQFSTKEKGKGTGIGLGIVKEIVARYDYTLSLNPRHKNTQFVLSIPADKAKILDEEQAKENIAS